MQTRRLCGAAALAAASSLALLPSAASARPHAAAGHRVTIHAAPNPITVGDGVVIFGRLFGPGHQSQPVALYHRLPGQPGFTLVQTGRTAPDGRYEFSRADGVVSTNRAWYVVSDGAFSRRVRERVHAAITLNPLTSLNIVTGTAYTFTGTVSPNHAGEVVELQRKQPGNGDDWSTIARARIKSDGTYGIVHSFRDPSTDQALGEAEVRVHFRGDRRNIQSSSDPLSLQVSQKQNGNLTINASPDPITIGQSVTISGMVEAPTAGQVLTLESRTDGTAFAPVPGATTVAGAAGSSYAFAPQIPTNNTLYRVVGANHAASAVVYVGVKDLISAAASVSSTTAGQVVTFTGAVLPDKTGHVLYLQRANPRTGDFHTVQIASVGAGSKYSIQHRVVVAGAPAIFRVRIPGGPENQGASSQSIPIQVAPNPTPLS